MILVILAGGMGSRFGGLKQLTPVDDEGNFILDYSIYDAKKAGFDKVVFIIKEENYDTFRETVGKRVEKRIKTAYVFQNNDNIPKTYNVPADRVKPFGTGHALLAAEKEIDDNFLVINADDFYGSEAYKAMGKILRKNLPKNEYAMVGYKLIETLSDSGKVKRGICSLKGEYLDKITESEIKVESKNDIYSRPLERPEQEWKKLPVDTISSMNIIGFSPDFLGYLKEGFVKFLEENKEDLSSVEYLLPAVVDELIGRSEVTLKVLQTDAKWQGITYREDLEKFKNFIKNQKKEGKYPEKLWN